MAAHPSSPLTLAIRPGHTPLASKKRSKTTCTAIKTRDKPVTPQAHIKPNDLAHRPSRLGFLTQQGLAAK